MENAYKINIANTKEGRREQMINLVRRAVLIKRELHEYCSEHGTSKGYVPTI